MKKLMACLAPALFVSLPCFGDYNGEIGVTAGNLDFDFGATSADGDSLGGFLQVFVGEVDTDLGPLAEAAFLDKATSWTISYRTADFDPDEFDTSAFNLRIINNLDYIFDIAVEDNEALLGESSSAGFGTYLNDTLAWTVNYTRFKDADLRELSGKIHGLVNLGSSWSLAYDGVVGYIDGDDESGYRAGGGADLFFTRNLSVGLNVEIADFGGADSVTIYRLMGEYFLYDIYHFALSYDSFDGDINTALLSASIRF